MMKAVRQPSSCAAATDKVQASGREDEATVVDIMTQPREIETCSQLPQQDDLGKVGLGSQLPKSAVDMTAAECHELFNQIIGAGKSDDDQCAVIVHATLTATEDDHDELIQQLEKQASAEKLSKSDHDREIEEINKSMDTGVHKPGTAERRSYHKLVGRRQRQEYVRGSKTHVKSYSFVNRNHGCYRPFGAIVQKEGGWKDKAAVRGTAVMALKCIKMGGEWMDWNFLTERLEFWHIKSERIENFTEA